MRLKSIKLAGFKSFVDPTTVPFSTNMTAIVGPNGCGKSNIIDAVRWVMGESSAKNLRGESMTDVIFNGSSGRQPVGQASIELLFDNTSGKLAGEYAAFSEISIKRKVTREGVSQYYLNGSKCRRRDVTDIFLGTGMGPRSYAIIEQGMIAKLIESKPEELRVYLEEAAGISKYKERRRETENRMRRTQENLDRLADIREELNKQLQHLKRQANAAERYAEYKKDERLFSAKLHYMYWKLLDTDLSGKSSLATQYEKEIENAVIGKNTNENKIDALKTLLDEKQALFNKFQAKFYQSGAEIATVEQKLKYEKSRKAEQGEQLDKLKHEIDELECVLGEDKESLSQFMFELEEISEAVFVLEESAESGAMELENEENKLHQWQIKWDEFNSSSSTAQKHAELEKAKIQEYDNRIKSLELRHDKLTREKLELNEQVESLDLHQWEEEQLVIDERILSSQQRLDALIPQIDECQSRVETLNEEKACLVDLYTSKKAVLASLETLQNSHESSETIDATSFLEENTHSEIKRVVNELDVDFKWESAVQHALKDWLNGYIVKGIDQSLVENVERYSQSILCVNSSENIVAPRPGSLAEKVSGAAALNHYLNTIMIADGLEAVDGLLATSEPEESVILPCGLWVSRNWVRTFKPDATESGVLSRVKEIANLKNELPGINEKIEKQEEEITRVKNASSDLKLSLAEEEGKLKVSTQEKTRLAALHSADQTKHEQYQLRIRRTDEELIELMENLEETRNLLEESRHIWQESLVNIEELTEKKDDYQNQREILMETLESVRRKSRDLQAAVHQKQLEKAQTQNKCDSISQTIQRLEKEKQYKLERKLELTNREGVDLGEIDSLALTLEGLLETRLIAEDKLNESKLALEGVSEELKIEESERVKHDSKLLAAREKLETIRMDTQALAINKKNLEERIGEDGFEINELADLILEEDSEDSLKQKLDQLANKIQRLGSINLAAIDEYKIQSERKEHLDSQNDELVDALDTLVDAIKKIDKETRARFKETFDQVNEGLQRLFPKIFGGGNAYLELTDDNLLETGVMIIARPPGKKNATIHLLSGGEKSLTAIALIFAIFELNPAPFCMLDEVDAPLDDANVGRFANMVKEMSSQVQFIYISHNKVSMEKADHLMGVTMHEPGVSRLVSVDVDEAAALVES